MTDDTNSEIGLFTEATCQYKKIVNDACLGFKTTHLITGASRIRYDCGTVVYWDDGLNPTRTMNIDDVPWKYVDTYVNGCLVRTYPTYPNGDKILNCESIRIAPLVDHPCLKISKGKTAGTLPNGSYQACIAYTVNQVRFTDYLALTSVQGLFEHENTACSLQIDVSNIDKDFDEFELVILANINAQTVAKRIGYYSSSQGTIYVDRWDPEYVTVPVGEIVFRSEPVEKSDALYPVGSYLLRTGIYSKFKFNYQPLANQIKAKWVAVEYPSDYYIKGNNQTGYMRDEQYAFFIRFIYNTGEFSDSYHIPGRPSLPSDLINIAGGDAFEGSLPTWKVYNTATITSTATSSPAYLQGGTIIASGDMAYWESTEKYPANKPDIWNSFPGLNSPLNLCGQPIRHHKMPDETIDSRLGIFNQGGTSIRLLGVQFENIKFPLDSQGNPITSIVGYEILRGSREGNKSIIAKGLLNNMMAYDIPGNSTVKGLFQNYPYNDLRNDSFLTPSAQTGTNGGVTPSQKLQGFQNNISDLIYSFHSPDTTFSNPYLNPYELKLYNEYNGSSIGRFVIPDKHPRMKMPTDAAKILVQTIATTISAAKGVYDLLAVTGGSGVSPITLTASEDLPLNRQLTINNETSFGVGVFGLGTGTIAGNPAIAARNVAAHVYNIAVEIAIAVIATNATYEQLYKIFTALLPKRQFASQFISHGFYNTSKSLRLNNTRRKINYSTYVSPSIQQFGTSYQINNVNRSRYIALEIGSAFLVPSTQDQSRYLISESNTRSINVDEINNISSYYGGIKLSIPSQYGQLESIKQFPVTTVDDNGTCKFTFIPGNQYKTGALFDGDIYISRFTEKNTMLFFSDWLMGQPDMYEYDYTLYHNIPYARHWVNNVELLKYFSIPSDYRVLDNKTNNATGTNVVEGWFYLFNSGVRDFFVESEVNVSYRDWEEDIPKRHYDPYRFTDLSSMFRSDIIKSGNYYKYDYSLSVSKLFGSHIGWGNLLPRDYNPVIQETCYTYRPATVIYSLPQQDDSKKDNWRAFLTNNKKEFYSKVTSIKSIDKTGALFMMIDQSPLSFMGVEELKLDGTGAKITIGDGKLFEKIHFKVKL
jgi:hypothetical protein